MNGRNGERIRFPVRAVRYPFGDGVSAVNAGERSALEQAILDAEGDDVGSLVEGLGVAGVGICAPGALVEELNHRVHRLEIGRAHV